MPIPQSLRDSSLYQREPALSRVLVGLGVPALGIALCVTLLRGWWLPCLFYELSGYYCPGCGSGRAARALLHGDPGAALGHNALFVLITLPCAWVLGKSWLRFVFPRLGLRPARLPDWAAPAALGIILAFWLLRNLPAFSFLAP